MKFRAQEDDPLMSDNKKRSAEEEPADQPEAKRKEVVSTAERMPDEELREWATKTDVLRRGFAAVRKLPEGQFKEGMLEALDKASDELIEELKRNM